MKARVLFKGQTATATLCSTSKDVKKCDLVVSDGTAVIGATIWGDVIESYTRAGVHISRCEIGLFQ